MESYTPPFQQTPAVVSLLAEICELVGRVEVAHRDDITVQLRRQNQIRSIHSSLAIEQNSLSLEQVSAILDGKRVLGPPHEIQFKTFSVSLQGETEMRHLRLAPIVHGVGERGAGGWGGEHQAIGGDGLV